MKWDSKKKRKYFYLHKFIVLTVSKGKLVNIDKDNIKLTGEVIDGEFKLFSVKKGDTVLSWEDTILYAKEENMKMMHVVVVTIFSLFSDLRKYLYNNPYQNIRIRPTKAFTGKKSCLFKNKFYED